MTENTSSAVMQQPREAKDSLDDFPTPSNFAWSRNEEFIRAGAVSDGESA